MAQPGPVETLAASVRRTLRTSRVALLVGRRDGRGGRGAEARRVADPMVWPVAPNTDKGGVLANARPCQQVRRQEDAITGFTTNVGNQVRHGFSLDVIVTGINEPTL